MLIGAPEIKHLELPNLKAALAAKAAKNRQESLSNSEESSQEKGATTTPRAMETGSIMQVKPKEQPGEAVTKTNTKGRRKRI